MTEQEIRALVITIINELNVRSPEGREYATERELRKREKRRKQEEADARARAKSPDGRLPYTFW